MCFDASRILRPPGTLNHKHTPARPVTLDEACPDRRYRLEDLTRDLALPPAPEPAPRAPSHTGGDRSLDLDTAVDLALLAIAPSVYVPVLAGVAELGRDRKVCCPIHNERTPSLHAYPTPEQGWFCFGCRRGGSIFDLAAAVWNLSTKGADFLEIKTRLRDLFL